MNKPREKGDKNLGRSNFKGRGKEAEFRTKKQKNELHILKMSQEWDLRRQKRRMDRQKWVEERRNQKLPIWQRVGNLRVQANEEIAHDTRNELVNKKQQIIENSNEATQSRVLNQDDEVKELSFETRGKDLGSALLAQGSKGTSFRENAKTDTAEIKFIENEKVRTMGQPLLYNVSTLKTLKNSTQIAEKRPIAAFKTPSKSLNNQAGEHLDFRKSSETGPEKAGNSNEANPVAIQKLLRLEPTNGQPDRTNRKRKLEAIYIDGDIDEMPSLMRVDKPTTLESIARENGPVTISSSANSAVVIRPSHKSVDQPENEKEEAMPQIKQCYSLQNRRDETPNFNFFAAKKSPTKSSPVSICKTSPVTMTTTSAAVKVQVAMPSVPVDSKCIVYLAKAPVPSPTPGTPTNPRPGYLLPVYKASTREAAYAFVPAGARRTHRVEDKSMSPLEGRAPNHVRSECSLNGSCTTVGHYVTRPYPSPNSMTALKEVHTGCVPATGKLLSGSQAPPALYSDHIHSKSRVHSCCDLISDTSALNPSQTDSVNTTGCSTGGSSKNSLVNVLKTITTHNVGLSRGSAIPPSSAPSLVQEISGGTLSASQEKPPYPPLCRIQEIAPNQTVLNNQEAIFNPMSVYVRAKLVPREVVAVNQGVELSPPLVEYIKTNAICDKELTKWSVKNVADFIAATDCADKAELFLEQEIDGKALLSLSPEMLMKGMNLKLGPSVKLYNHIINLRTALSL